MARLLTGLFVLSLVDGCYTHDPLWCVDDSDCADAPDDRRFCDRTGEYPESRGIARTCIVAPGGVALTVPSSAIDLPLGVWVDVPVTIERGPGIQGSALVEGAVMTDRAVEVAPAMISSGDVSGVLRVRTSVDGTTGYATLNVRASIGDISSPYVTVMLDVVGLPGTRDTSFGDEGGVVVTGLRSGELIGPVTLFPQGEKLVVVGSPSMVRLLPDGSVDPFFGANGRVTFGISALNSAAAAMGRDGRIIVAVEQSSPGGVNRALIATYSPDGGVLVPFKEISPSTDGQGIGSISACSDGTVVIHGQETPHVVMWRLDKNLRLDPDFGDNGKVVLPPESSVGGRSRDGVYCDKNGGILFNHHHRVRRLATDGGIDQAFGDGGVAALPIDVGQAYWHRVQETAQGFLVYGSSDRGGMLWKLRQGGDIDGEFGSGGYSLVSTRDGYHFVFVDGFQSANGMLHIAGGTRIAGSGYDFPTMVQIDAAGRQQASYGDGGYAVDKATPFFFVSAAFVPRHRVYLMGLDEQRSRVIVRKYWY